ncbi:tRNA epoxyqueuosine(34) reductase QueG [Sphingomonas sp. CGMCC 1.13654]|uniref:Epoxyqueuosine reductase n=1 Tax=Sphingomonas chungangi TaxID=2683589 RepID=A0A838LA33_9SPHN|nr:tRNA epoxyqueuosine(34) reductase QueG [Sphingomonas chungangi]MBA2936044.1 tRNA epoxyqueuosine(34) reductase QueG [Sphingomonas chungangi]MVW55433.1 tRNA epoxyqueuosine(34) reductase QueG [Sphingomonas chungangi]
MPDATLTERLKAEAARLGFVACGVTRAVDEPLPGERLMEWLGEGAHGSMGWMEARADWRRSPRALWAEVQSVVALGMSYAPSENPMRLAAEMETARISVYAQGQDYHDVVKKALKGLARWLAAEAEGALKVFVDTAPVMEKPLAMAAGLGWQGKHTNLVSREHGSWLLLGCLMTELELEPDAPSRDTCGSCDACQVACPTGAFPAPYRIDARRCISYLTIEHDGPIPRDLRAGIGNHVYGCDDCLSVCPWNKFAQAGRANLAFASRAELAALQVADLLALDDANFRQVFSGSPIKRIGRDRMVRNAAIVAGNSARPALAGQLEPLLDDPSPLVRGAVVWALGKLGRLDPARMTNEQDDAVREEWNAALSTRSP